MFTWQVAHHWEHHEWREVMGSTWLVVGVGAHAGDELPHAGGHAGIRAAARALQQPAEVLRGQGGQGPELGPGEAGRTEPGLGGAPATGLSQRCTVQPIAESAGPISSSR